MVEPQPPSPPLSNLSGCPKSPRSTPPPTRPPFSELYFENALGKILPKYSKSPLRLSDNQIEVLSSDLEIDINNKAKEVIIKEIMFKILLSKKYANRYGHFNSDFETQCYLKQEVFRRTIYMKHGEEIRAQLEIEKAVNPSIEKLNSERERLKGLIQEGSMVAPFVEFDEEEYTRRVLENANIIPPGVSILALPATELSPNLGTGKASLIPAQEGLLITPSKAISPNSNPNSPYGAKSWAKEVEEGECSVTSVSDPLDKPDGPFQFLSKCG